MDLISIVSRGGGPRGRVGGRGTPLKLKVAGLGYGLPPAHQRHPNGTRLAPQAQSIGIAYHQTGFTNPAYWLSSAAPPSLGSFPSGLPSCSDRGDLSDYSSSAVLKLIPWAKTVVGPCTRTRQMPNASIDIHTWLCPRSTAGGDCTCTVKRKPPEGWQLVADYWPRNPRRSNGRQRTHQ